MEERVEHGDVEAASRLLSYFQAHAMRVYAELAAPDPLDLFAADLRTLIEEAGGQLEATATELYRFLEEAGCEVLPARPKELSQYVKVLSARSSTLQAVTGHRGKERILRLQLLENSVGSVGSVGGSPPETDATVATDASSEYQVGQNAAPTDATVATDARFVGSDDGRKRFTV